MSALTNAARIADKLIDKYGAVSTWRKYNASVNSSQPWKSTAGGSATEYSVKIVLLPFGSGSNPMDALQMLIAGTSVPVGTEIGLLSSKIAFTPAINDMVVINGETKEIKAIEILRPDGIPVMYTLVFA